MQHIGGSSRIGTAHQVEEAEGTPADELAIVPVESRKADESERSWNRWVGELVEQLCRMYGYALVGVGSNIAFIAGVSTLEFTRWTAITSTTPGSTPAERSKPTLNDEVWTA